MLYFLQGWRQWFFAGLELIELELLLEQQSEVMVFMLNFLVERLYFSDQESHFKYYTVFRFDLILLFKFISIVLGFIFLPIARIFI